MKTQDKIFVIGHKNPDTDSICSAIAYADLKNRTSQGARYLPKRAGQLSPETEYVLNRFGVASPGYMSNLGTQVKDMDIHVTPKVDATATLKMAWDLMRANVLKTLPIVNDAGELQGLVTIGDIAQTYIENMDNTLLSDARTRYRAIAEDLGGIQAQILPGRGRGL